ncbi:MAG: nuclear transport factor 2 family protein [Ectothiorhodospira sp.]
MSESIEPWARRYAAFFSSLTEPDLDHLGEFFDPGARFKDPFNDVTGLEEIRRVFLHMFHQCPAPRFYLHSWAVQDNTAFFHWRFTDREEDAPGRMRLDVDGVSRVIFNEAGRAVSHVDYWDPAEYVYDQIPGVRGILRLLRRRIGA